jgi:hypothetical protein
MDRNRRLLTSLLLALPALALADSSTPSPFGSSRLEEEVLRLERDSGAGWE